MKDATKGIIFSSKNIVKSKFVDHSVMKLIFEKLESSIYVHAVNCLKSLIKPCCELTIGHMELWTM